MLALSSFLQGIAQILALLMLLLLLIGVAAVVAVLRWALGGEDDPERDSRGDDHPNHGAE